MSVAVGTAQAGMFCGEPVFSATKRIAGSAKPPQAAMSGSKARAPIGEFAREELALDLEPDEQEEDRHQAIIHPEQQWLLQWRNRRWRDGWGSREWPNRPPEKPEFAAISAKMAETASARPAQRSIAAWSVAAIGAPLPFGWDARRFPSPFLGVTRYRLGGAGQAICQARTRNSLMIERLLERFLFASRWLLAPFYVMLVAALGVLLLKAAQELLHFIGHAVTATESEVILGVLALIDLTLDGLAHRDRHLLGLRELRLAHRPGKTEDCPNGWARSTSLA